MKNDDEQIIFGVHPVLELVEARPGGVERLFVAREGGRGMGRLLRIAREKSIPVTHLPRTLLARKVGRGKTHQGIAAVVAPFGYADVDQLCRTAASRSNGLLVLLDRVVDPGNLGAVLRSAAAGGADGVILAADSTAGLTAGAFKTSAGAAERIPVARERNARRRLESLVRDGFRAFLLDPRARESWDRVDLTGRVVLVAGGEERGVRPSVASACNHQVAIPLAAGVESLNVAVSVGVLLFEAVRQRRQSPGAGP